MRRIIGWVGFIVLVVFAFTMDVSELLAAVASVKLHWLAVAFGFNFITLCLKAIRWQLMVREVGRTNIKFSYALAAVLAGVAGSSLLPGRAFEVTKPMMLQASDGIPIWRTIPAVLFERLLDLASLFTLFLLSSMIVSTRVQYSNPWLYGATLFGMACSIVMMWRPRWGLAWIRRGLARFKRPKAIDGAIESVEEFVDTWQRADTRTGWVLLSGAGMLAEAFRAYATFVAFDITVSPVLITFAFTGSILVGLLTLIPGGIGITETSQFGFLTLLLPGVAEGALRSAVLLERFISYYLLVAIGALVLLLAGRMSRFSTHGASSETGVVEP